MQVAAYAYNLSPKCIKDVEQGMRKLTMHMIQTRKKVELWCVLFKNLIQLYVEFDSKQYLSCICDVVAIHFH